MKRDSDSQPETRRQTETDWINRSQSMSRYMAIYLCIAFSIGATSLAIPCLLGGAFVGVVSFIGASSFNH